MPKEISHWWLAEEVLRELHSSAVSAGKVPANRKSAAVEKIGDEGSLGMEGLAAILKQHKNLFLLGAVGPDFLFYYLFGPQLRHFLKAAGVLHGSDGSDTLAVLAATVEKWGTEVPPGVLAFLFGYACHVAADAAFHPMVLYFSGKGTENARYNHHLFESVLDLYVLQKLSPQAPTSEASASRSSVPRKLRDLVAEMEMSREDFLNLLGRVSFHGEDYSQKALARCLSRFEFVQSAFWQPWGQGLARFIGLLSPKLRHFKASFYQKRYYDMTGTFDEVLTYRHPVTGEETQDSILSLRDKMVGQAISYAEFFAGQSGSEGPRGETPSGTEDSKDGSLKDRTKKGMAKSDLITRLSLLKGPNLETGIFGDRAEDIRYTDPQGVEGLFRPPAK